MTQQPSVAILGLSTWGSQIVRVCRTLGYPIIGVDPVAAKRNTLRRRYPDISVTANPEDVWNDPHIQGVIIATPSSTHAVLAESALKANKHVFVEKPMTQNPKEAFALVRTAKRMRRILMVDHTFIYSPALKIAKAMIRRGDLGTITGITSRRMNTDTRRTDSTLLWDLAPHDISIAWFLLDAYPEKTAVSNTYSTHTSPHQATITMRYKNGIVYVTDISWKAPKKERQLIITGTRGTVTVTWQKSAEKISYRASGKIRPRRIASENHTEPLELALRAFFSAIKTGALPKTGGTHGARVVDIIASLERVREPNSQ